MFFGRQEVRKGLFVFLDALDLLFKTSRPRELDDWVVTFLGKSTPLLGTDSQQLIRSRSLLWTFTTQILSDKSNEQAIAYLQQKGRLAVMPSLIENYPNTVLECLAFQVPFLASRVGSIPEQIHEEDIGAVASNRAAPGPGRSLATCTPRRARPCPTLLRLTPELSRVGRVARKPCRTDADAREPSGLTSTPPRTRELTISVCLTSNGNPNFLRQALDSMLAQDQGPFEVTVVHSSSGDSQPALDAVADEYDFSGRGWRLIKHESRNEGAARNRAAMEAIGEYLLFMSDDIVAKPHQISTFKRVAKKTSADILSSLICEFGGEDPPDFRTTPDSIRLSTGANLSLSVLCDSTLGASTLIRRTAFHALEGYSEDTAIPGPEWELFCRSMLKGFTVELVPELLCWRRSLLKRLAARTTRHRPGSQALSIFTLSKSLKHTTP